MPVPACLSTLARDATVSLQGNYDSVTSSLLPCPDSIVEIARVPTRPLPQVAYVHSLLLASSLCVYMLQALRPNSGVASLPDGAKQVLHVNNFNVDYRPDGSIQQFNSDLSVWDVDGHELQRNAIFVNKPLRCVCPFWLSY